VHFGTTLISLFRKPLNLKYYIFGTLIMTSNKRICHDKAKEDFPKSMNKLTSDGDDDDAVFYSKLFV
jgi:hypothetical protein